MGLREELQHRGGAGRTPIVTVSGVSATNVGMIRWFDQETTVAVITTKSIQLSANPGNREPILTEPEPGSFGNAVGLKNPGLAAAQEELSALRGVSPLRSLLAVSLSGATVAEFVELACALAPLSDLLELNYSCPHAAAGYGTDIGKDDAAIKSITAAVVTAVPGTPVLVKLTPNVPDIAKMARIAVAAGAAGISAINTVGPEIYLHPESGATILSNPPEGRGGKSGTWVHERAIEAIAAIRESLGPEPILIGMGGVGSAAQVQAMTRAGADAVGIGSALATVHQERWPRYLDALARGDEESVEACRAAGPGHRPDLRVGRRMAFQRRTITARRELGAGLFELELEGTVSYAPGELVFLWLPSVGEKPFSPALARPATFLIKRRGAVTRALGRLERGETVYLRGPYGQGHDPGTWLSVAENRRALLLGAGSGAALLPAIGEAILRAGGSVTSYIGNREAIKSGSVVERLERAGEVRIIRDDGATARVLEVVRRDMESSRIGGPPIGAAYAVGPEPFMLRATRVVPLPANRLYLSLEKPMRCGVGLCGECHVHGHLTCFYGTIVSAASWTGHLEGERHAP